MNEKFLIPERTVIYKKATRLILLTPILSSIVIRRFTDIIQYGNVIQ